MPGRRHTLVMTKLDRLVRSLPDARAITDELTARQVNLNPGGSVSRTWVWAEVAGAPNSGVVGQRSVEEFRD